MFLNLGLLLVFSTFGGVSAACGLLAAPARRKTSEGMDQNLLHILIPAHNEEKKIAYTFESIEQEWKRCPFPIKITVGMDSCTDGTAAVVNSWSSRLPITGQNFSYRSKWKNLKALVQGADQSAPWVFLIDAGTVLDEGVFTSLRNQMIDSDVAALAPSYRMEGSSQLHAWFWMFERQLKTWENNLGGPISIHGAAVAYRRDVIQAVYAKLEGEGEFKNDDVILPLASRVFFPDLKIRYLPNTYIHDNADHEKLDFKTQWIRRKRMVLGNLQWLRFAIREEKRMSGKVWVVALRRILRPFWFVSFLILSLGLFFYSPVLAMFLLIPGVLFLPAALASLYAPIAFLRREDQVDSTWR